MVPSLFFAFSENYEMKSRRWALLSCMVPSDPLSLRPRWIRQQKGFPFFFLERAILARWLRLVAQATTTPFLSYPLAFLRCPFPVPASLPPTPVFRPHFPRPQGTLFTACHILCICLPTECGSRDAIPSIRSVSPSPPICPSTFRNDPIGSYSPEDSCLSASLRN